MTTCIISSSFCIKIWALQIELLNSWISSLSVAQPLNLPTKAECGRDAPTTTSAYLVLSFLACCVRRRERKNDSQQSNKTEEQWRHWIAKYQVWIRSSASLGLPSSVRLNYVLLTVSSRVSSVVFAGKLSGSAWSNCLWLSWVSPSTMQRLSKRSKVTVKIITTGATVSSRANGRA